MYCEYITLLRQVDISIKLYILIYSGFFYMDLKCIILKGVFL
jgi:hypothetical protein